MLQKISDWVKTNIGFDGLLNFAVCTIMIALIKAMTEPLPAVAEFKDLCDLAGILIGVL